MEHYEIYIHKNQFSSEKFFKLVNEYFKAETYRKYKKDYTIIEEDGIFTISDIHIDFTLVEANDERFLGLVNHLIENLNASGITCCGNGINNYHQLENFKPKFLNRIKYAIKVFREYK